MPLRKRTIDLPLGGLDQKTTAKGVMPPSVLTLQNGRYVKEGRIDKAYGYASLGQADSTQTNLGAIRDELLAFSADTLYSYATKTNTWQDKGSATIASVALEKISASEDDGTKVDTIIQDGLQVSIWEETSVRYKITDEDTGSDITPKTILTSANSARLAAISGNIYIFYVESISGDLKAFRIPTSNPTSTSTTTLYTGSNTIDSNHAYDVQGLNSNIYLFFKVTGVTTARISKLDQDLTVVATNTVSSDPQSTSSTAMLAFNSTSAGKDLIFLGWKDGSNNIKTIAYDVTLTAEYSLATVQSSLANASQMLLAIGDSTGSSVDYIYVADRDWETS